MYVPHTKNAKIYKFGMYILNNGGQTNFYLIYFLALAIHRFSFLNSSFLLLIALVFSVAKIK